MGMEKYLSPKDIESIDLKEPKKIAKYTYLVDLVNFLSNILIKLQILFLHCLWVGCNANYQTQIKMPFCYIVKFRV
jgi:hypothetical protein